MKSRVLRGVLTALATAALLPATAAAAGATGAAESPPPRVLAVEFDNDVNPVTADYVVGQIERANEERFDAVAILLDTPGGLSTSMEEIYEAELASRVPVIVYVSPPGADATSAGVFIAQAADVLAMAPATSIGSSTPVGGEGGDLPSDIRRKAINSFASTLRGLARRHGRNVQWADAAVRRAANLEADEALRQNVVDEVAPSLPQLLDRIDGQKTKFKGIVLETRGAEIERVEMSLWKRVLDTLIDPNLIVILMSIGVLGITIELWSPGLIFPGTIGAISLVVGLFGLQVLPISWAGVLLMLLAAGFFAAELFVTSHGVLALAGALSFVVGSLMLFDPAGDAYQVSLPVALAVAAALALLFGIAVAKVVQVRRAPVASGQEELIGQVGVVRQAVDPVGLVFVHGELWRAKTSAGAIAPGERVRVEGLDDALTLTVAPA